MANRHPNREAAEAAVAAAIKAGRGVEGYAQRYSNGWAALVFYTVALPEGGTVAQTRTV